jgi:hypothetical protein
MDGTFDRIGDDFLYDFSSLEEIKLPRLFGHVNSISRNFLASCPALKKVDLSTLSEVNGIGSNFMSNNFSLSNIDLSPLSQVTSIGDGFMSSDFSLKSVDLSN